MSVGDLDKLLAPRRVAVVGAGADPSSVGHVVLRNLVDGGFEGDVQPVNPGLRSVRGLEAYPSVTALPVPPDLAVVCTPASAVSSVIRDCGEAGVPAAAVISAGFREIGTAGRDRERELAAQTARFGGPRILGPNCLGLIVPRLGLNASFSQRMPADGEIAFVTQSGALATAVIDWAASEGIGFSHLISLGNMLDVDLGDAIDYLATDRRTRSLVLYVENVTNARKFMSAARAFTLAKPIVAYKAGRFPASAQAAVSHTGAIAGEDATYDAAFERAGIVRVGRMEELFATAELLSRARARAGARLAIVTNAGGPGVMAADELLARGGTLAELSADTRGRLESSLPASASTANPVDVLGDAGPERFRAAVEAVLYDHGADAVLVILTPQAMTDPAAVAEAIATARPGSKTPVLAAWLGGASVRGGATTLSQAGISTYDYPEQAVDAFLHIAAYSRNLATLYETPRAIPAAAEGGHADARRRAERTIAGTDGVLGEMAAKELFEAYGIATTKPRPADSTAAAVEAAEEIGYPVVLKVRSPEITHKTDVGGVVTGISTPEEVEAAFERIATDVARLRPDARVDGVTVQSMAPAPGYELLLGAHRDRTFGAVIVIGAGGIGAELAEDRALGLPPLNERLAARMLESLRIRPLLAGYRSRPAVDIDALVGTIIRFSYLVADHPRLAEIEANPLLATPEGTLALDARAVTERRTAVPAGSGPARSGRFSHLAIRPYPDELAARVTTRSGLSTLLRPIRPEDEPLWREMLEASSLDSIRMRFRGLVRYTHETAARYCFIDYDRELAIVAELAAGARKRLVGVGRLVADPDHRRAEYAILIADPWQGRGLGDAITARCLEIAGEWGLESVFAETTPANRGMIALLEGHGFQITRRPEEGLVVGERRVA